MLLSKCYFWAPVFASVLQILLKIKNKYQSARKDELVNLAQDILPIWAAFGVLTIIF